MRGLYRSVSSEHQGTYASLSFCLANHCEELANSVWLIRYKNMAALEAHRQSDVYAMVQKRGAETQLLAAAPDIKILQHVGGFASR